MLLPLFVTSASQAVRVHKQSIVCCLLWPLHRVPLVDRSVPSLQAYLASETEDSDEGDAVGDQPGAGTEEDEAAVGSP